MNCSRCGKEINKDEERRTYNNRTERRVTYDQMGYQIRDICLECIDKENEESYAWLNEVSRYIREI